MDRVQRIINHLEPTNKIQSIENNQCNNTNNANYRYTVDKFVDRVFTKEERDFYEENGYIVIRGLLPIKDVNICNKRFDDLVSNPSLRIPEMLVMRDISLKKKGLTKDRTNKSEVTKLQKVN